MKKLKCKFCYETWYVEEETLDKLKVCPCCAGMIRQKINITEFDSLDKAIYGVITNAGMDILQNSKQLFGYLLDIAPELRKEIHIFSRICNEEYLTYIREIFEKEISEAELILCKLRRLFIDEEGLSESWADMLCTGIWGAVKYVKGIEVSDIMLAELEEIEIFFDEDTNREVSKDNKSNPINYSASRQKNKKAYSKTWKKRYRR